MDQPLGRAVGNALEVDEARDTVRGDGPEDFTELVLDASARLLAHSDLGIDVEEGRRRAEAAVADGSALEAYERWIRAQGGDPDPSALERAPVREPCPRRATASFGASAHGPSVSPRSSWAPGAARRRTRSTTRSASSASRSAATPSSRATTSPRCTRETMRPRSGRVEAVLAAYELGDEPPPERGILLDVVD